MTCILVLKFFLSSSNKPKNTILLLQMQSSCWMKRSTSRSSCLRGFGTMENAIKNRTSGLRSSPSSWKSSLTLQRGCAGPLLLLFQLMVLGLRKTWTQKICFGFCFFIILFLLPLCLMHKIRISKGEINAKTGIYTSIIFYATLVRTSRRQ